MAGNTCRYPSRRRVNPVESKRTQLPTTPRRLHGPHQCHPALLLLQLPLIPTKRRDAARKNSDNQSPHNPEGKNHSNPTQITQMKTEAKTPKFRKVTHQQFATLAAKLKDERALVEKMFADGTAVTGVAKHYDIPESTLRDACDFVGIQYPKRGTIVTYSKDSQYAIRDLLIVVKRIAEKTGVDCVELEGH